MRLGQHFLINENISYKIIDGLELSLDDTVLEIGGGKGILTEKLIDKVKKLYVVEIDKNLASFLKEKFKMCNNIEVINEDFLKLDLDKFRGRSFKIVGNIPYSITTKILNKLFLSNKIWKICVIMLQKEVAYKLLAKVGSKFFCKLTLFANFYTKINKICDVKKEDFQPQPKVDSTVLKFLPNLEFSDYEYENLMLKVINLAFKHKRKKLINSLSLGTNLEKKLIEKLLVDSGINITQRPNEVDIYKFKKITEKLATFI